jgi:hypothetical protein
MQTLRAGARVDFLAVTLDSRPRLGLLLASTREVASGAPAKINRALDLIGGGRLVRRKSKKRLTISTESATKSVLADEDKARRNVISMGHGEVSSPHNVGL